jgi:hypothetical protein
MTAIAHPIGIYIFGLGGGFLLPILYQLGHRWLHAGFVIAFAEMTLCTVLPAFEVLRTGIAIEILTAGALPPVSISLRFGPMEAAVSASATLVAALLAISFWDTLRTPPSACRRMATICASVYLLVFIQNLLMHLAEKILLMQPLTFGGDWGRRRGEVCCVKSTFNRSKVAQRQNHQSISLVWSTCVVSVCGLDS